MHTMSMPHPDLAYLIANSMIYPAQRDFCAREER